MGGRLVRGRLGDQPDSIAQALGRLELSHAVSRRGLLGTAAAGLVVSAPMFEGCGGGGTEPGDAELLNQPLALEQTATVAYTAAAERLSGSAEESARRFARQAEAHAELLREQIEDLGGTPVEPRSEERYRRELRLDRLDDEETLNLAVDLANTGVAAYTEVIAKLTDAELRGTLFELVAVEAQQISVFLGELGEPQVPDAFVVGAQA